MAWPWASYYFPHKKEKLRTWNHFHQSFWVKLPYFEGLASLIGWMQALLFPLTFAPENCPWLVPFTAFGAQPKPGWQPCVGTEEIMALDESRPCLGGLPCWDLLGQNSVLL